MIERDHPALVGKYRYDAKVFYQSNATYDPSGIAQTPPQATHTVARLRALALKATPGPWDFEQNALLQDNGWAGALLGRVREPRDVAYISAADPQTVLALLDELARLRESALRSSTDASVPEGGGSLDEPKCSPTLTLCPRCKNDIAKCDGLFATREDEHD